MMRSTTALNAEADAIGYLLNGGFLDLMDGKAPGSPNTAVTQQRRLARLKFASPAFQKASNGSATAQPLEPERDAPYIGVVTWFRASRKDGVVVLDGVVGTSQSSPADLVLDSQRIVPGTAVYVSGLTYTAKP